MSRGRFRAHSQSTRRSQNSRECGHLNVAGCPAWTPSPCRVPHPESPGPACGLRRVATLVPPAACRLRRAAILAPDSMAHSLIRSKPQWLHVTWTMCQCLNGSLAWSLKTPTSEHLDLRSRVPTCPAMCLGVQSRSTCHVCAVTWPNSGIRHAAHRVPRPAYGVPRDP